MWGNTQSSLKPDKFNRIMKKLTAQRNRPSVGQIIAIQYCFSVAYEISYIDFTVV